MRYISYLAVIACVSACAHVDIRPLTAKEITNPNSVVGARFYPPEPYLLQAKTKDGCISSIVYLPKSSEPWVVEPHPYGLGSMKASGTLTDGWNLTTFGAENDTKIPETVTALTGAAKLGLPAAAPEAPKKGGAAAEPPCPAGLTKLGWDGKSWSIPNTP